MSINLEKKNIISFFDNYSDNNILYLPVLGPVYTSGHDVKKVILDLLDNADSKDFLSYDKNNRWFSNKTEYITFDYITDENSVLYFFVRDDFRKVNKIFLYCKGSVDQEKIDLEITLLKSRVSQNGHQKTLVYFFKKPKIKKNVVCHDIFIKKILDSDKLLNNYEDIVEFSNLSDDLKKTLGDLGKEDEMENFSYLAKEIDDGRKRNKIFCAVEEDHVIGAIGPIDIVDDAWGVPSLLPPNFGVKENARGRGFGKKLWETFINHALAEGAKYTLVQNKKDSSASKFYSRQGLINSGSVYSVVIEN